MSTGDGRISCAGCGCVLRVPSNLSGLIHCPRCGKLIAVVEEEPQDIQMVMVDRSPDVGRRPQAQAESSAALAELVQAAASSNAPNFARHSARLRETNARRNTAIIWLSVLLVVLAAVGGVCYWFVTHPLLRVLAPDGKVLYEGRPSEEDAPRITIAVLAQYQKDADAAKQVPHGTGAGAVQSPEPSPSPRGATPKSKSAPEAGRDADIFDTQDRLRSADGE